MTARAVCAAIAIVAAGAPPPAQAPVFRTRAESISVYASVKQGNRIVANLTAADFALTDNGVPQTVDAVALESVPIDVTLFLDTSGSTAGKLDEMKRDVQGIVKLLRPADRFRLLTIGDSVYEPVPWVQAGTPIDLSFGAVGGISLINDALTMALLHRTDPDRRHLIVGMTDREDCGSVVSSALLRELASRSEAVMHLIEQSGGGGSAEARVRTCSPRGRVDGPEIIRDAAERTGGELHTGALFFRSRSLLNDFKKIFDEFRQSYMLRYTVHGVASAGWHAIEVRVPAIGNATVHARKGYYGDVK